MLDPKFAKIIRLMNSTEHAGEKQSARARADAVAATCGMSFDEALAEMRRAEPPPFVNIFAGFDDHMEAKEPGWKAERAKEHAERRRRHAEKRAAVLAKYGSEDAALAPCEYERLLLAAVKPWRVAQKKPHDRWTDNLGGWQGHGYERKGMPPHILEAILNAYPLPTTFAAAKAEHDHWEMRDDEMESILDTDGLGLGDTALDTAACVRAEAVRDLALRDLHLTTIADLHARFVMYRALESTWEKVEDAIFRDLEAMVKAEADPSNQSTVISPDPGSANFTDVNRFGNHRNGDGHPSLVSKPFSPDLGKTYDVAGMLRADPGRSDRDIARATGCSPTTVGKVRRGLGLVQPVRFVHRRGQMYRMATPRKPVPAGSAEADGRPLDRHKA